MITVYGIRSCDSCRRALNWLRERHIEHCFHDVRDDGLDDALLRRLQKLERRTDEAMQSSALLNRRSTTWRQLEDDARRDLDAAGIRALILRHPTMMKRPVIDTGEDVLVGFDESARNSLLDDT